MARFSQSRYADRSDNSRTLRPGGSLIPHVCRSYSSSRTQRRCTAHDALMVSGWAFFTIMPAAIIYQQTASGWPAMNLR